MPTFTILKGFDQIGEATTSESLRANLSMYLDWGFVDKGAFWNINIPQSGAYGGDATQLRAVKDRRYTDGQVWEGFRTNWAWESGVGQSVDPIRVSGVFIGSEFIPVGTGLYINYPDGQAIFEEARPTTSTVTAEYSFRWINVIDAENIPWFKEVQYASQRVDSSHFLQTSSGDWSQLAQTRLPLPAIAMEFGRTTYKPRGLGFGMQDATTELFFHVFAEDNRTSRKIADILSQQTEKTIFMFNLDLMASQTGFPLDERGMLVDIPKTYPELVETEDNGGFRHRKLRLFDSETQNTQVLNQRLHKTTVRMSGEVLLFKI